MLNRITPFSIFISSILILSTVANVPYTRSSRNKEPGHPVVLIPGFGGSQLEANLTGKPEVVHYICSKQTSTYFDLWLNLELFGPLVIDCWVDNMLLVFNETTGTTTNMPGVDIKVPQSTSSIEWLDKSKASSGRYFTDLVEMLVSWGYRRGKDVIGAPFDWRKAPNEMGEYFILLKSMIEDAYRYNDNKKVVLVGHSMGNPVLLYFFNHIVDQDWKDKYIKSHVSLAAPYGGSMQIVRLFTTGYNMNYYRILLAPSKLRSMQRSFTSSVFLFPNPTVWGADDILAAKDTKNYTVSNIEEFFKDINFELGWEQYKHSGTLLGNLTAPGVEVHCLYGNQVETPEQFRWTDYWFPDYQPYITYGDGDGTVNLRSAEVCKRWNTDNNAGKNVVVRPIEKAEHMAILNNPTALEYIRKVVYDEDPISKKERRKKVKKEQQQQPL